MFNKQSASDEDAQRVAAALASTITAGTLAAGVKQVRHLNKLKPKKPASPAAAAAKQVDKTASYYAGIDTVMRAAGQPL